MTSGSRRVLALSLAAASFVATVVVGLEPSPTAEAASRYEDVVLLDDPVAYWRLNETSGTTATDLGSQGIDATYSGVSGSYQLGQPSPVVDGASVYLDGSDGFVYVADSWTPEALALAPEDELSIELWFRPDSLPLDNQFHQLARWRWFGWGLRILNGTLYGDLWEDGSSGPQLTTVVGPALNAGEWYHAVLTKDADEVSLYVNGQVVDQAPSNGPAYYETVLPDCCGTGGGVGFGRDADVDTFHFAGWLTEVAVYDKALSSSEVDGHNEVGNDGPTYVGGGNPYYGTSPDTPQIEDPVNAATGSFYHPVADLLSPPGTRALVWSRTYESMSEASTGFGAGWRHSFSDRIQLTSGGAVEYVRSDGRGFRYDPDGSGGWVRPEEAPGELVAETDGSWRIDALDGTTMRFAPDGELTSVELWDGETITLAYTAGLLDSLVASTGASLAVSWVDDRIVSVVASDGRRVDYAYDASDRIMSSTTERGGESYGYSSGGYLDELRDTTGRLIVLNTYDPAGRVVTQTNAYGAVSRFEYDNIALATTVTDEANSQQLVYQFDERGRMTSISDPLGFALTRTFDASGNLIGEQTRDGIALTATYNDEEQPLTVTLPGVGTTTYSYDPSGRVVSMTEPTGAITTFGYDGAERYPSSVTDGLGATSTMEVVDGLVTSVTDPDGVTVASTFDAQRRKTSATDGLGRTTLWAFDARGNLIQTTNPDNTITTYSYDSSDRMTEMVAADGGVTSYVYDSDGRLLSTTDPTGATTSHEYDAAGRRTATVDPVGVRTEQTYDSTGRLIATTVDGEITQLNREELARIESTETAEGRVTEYDYDAAGRTTARTAPDGGSSTTLYDPDGRVASTTDAEGRTTTFGYDAFGRVNTSTDPSGGVTTTAHDLLGRPISVTSPDGGTTSTAYTPGGRMASVTDPTGHVTSFSYDVAGQLVSTTNGLGETTSYAYDDMGRLVTQTSPSGLAATSTYDAMGRLISQTTPAGVVRSMTWSLRGEMLSEQLGNDSPSTFAYNPDGTLATSTDPLGNTTTYTYDGRKQLVQQTDAEGGVETWTYDGDGFKTSHTDELGRTTQFAYELNGRLATVTDPSGRTTTYAYNLAGQVTRTTASRGTDTHVVDYTYDAAGRRATMVDPTGATSYTYDPSGRIASITSPTGTISYAYDAAGRRIDLTYPDGTTAAADYDTAGRLTTLSVPGLGDTAYEYDADGNLTSTALPGHTRERSYVNGRLTTYLDGADLTTATYDAAGRVETLVGATPWTYTYDQGGQLTQAVATGQDSYVHDYDYSPLGERTTIDSPAGRADYDFDAASQITSLTVDGESYAFEYDEAGRVTKEYDAFGVLTETSYDPRGLIDQVVRTTPPPPGPAIPYPEPDPNRKITGKLEPIFECWSSNPDGSYTAWWGYENKSKQGPERVGRTVERGPDNQVTPAVHDGDQPERFGIPNVIPNKPGRTAPGAETPNAFRTTDWDGSALTWQLDGRTATANTNPSNECDAVPPPAEPTVTIESRTYNGNGQLVEVEQVEADGSVTTTPITWDLAAPVPQVLALGDTNYFYGATREASIGPDGPTIERHDLLGSTITNGATYDPLGAPDNTIDGVGFGYRGELAVQDRLHLRFRDLSLDHGVFTTTDPVPGFAGRTTTSNPYHYVDNNPTNSIDPLGLTTFDETILEPALEFFVPDPAADCDPVCGYFDVLIGGAYQGEDITELNTWEFAKYQVQLCYNAGIIDTGVGPAITELGNGIPGIVDARGLCIDWMYRYEELGGDRCTDNFVTNIIDWTYEQVGGGGACYSWGLAVEAWHEEKWEILANSVTLGGYGCAKDTGGYILNDDAPTSQAVTGIVQCVGFAFGLSALRGGFQAIGTLRRPGVTVAHAATTTQVPPRFISTLRGIIDRASITRTISPQKQARHIRSSPKYEGGGYFESVDEAQRVLDAFHDGSAQILGVTPRGHIVVRVRSSTGTNVNTGAGFPEQVTDVFFIKGQSSPSVVPANPMWTP